MSCPKTEYLLQEYFSDDLAPLAREELGKHLEVCPHCHAELESLLLTQTSLRSWQEQRVPHWNRGLNLFKREHRAPNLQVGGGGRTDPGTDLRGAHGGVRVAEGAHHGARDGTHRERR